MTFNDIIITFLSLCLVPLLTWVTKWAISLIEVKIDNNKTTKYFNIAEDAIISAVVAVNQMFVDQLKKEGAFDDEKKAEAFAKAKDIALGIMSSASKEFITAAVGDFDVWIKAKIEATVNAAK